MALVLLTVLGFLWLGCGDNAVAQQKPEPKTPTNAPVSKRIQYQNARRAQGHDILIIGSGETELRDSLTKIFASISNRRGWSQPQIFLDNQVPKEYLRQKVLTLIGTPKTNNLLKRLQPNLSLKWIESKVIVRADTIDLRGRCYAEQMIPNPENLELPISVITSLDPQDILMYFGGSRFINRSRHWDFLLLDKSGNKLMGYLLEPGGSVDSTNCFDFRAEARALTQFGPFNLLNKCPDITNPFLQSYLEDFNLAFSKYKLYTTTKFAEQKHVYIYPDQEVKGLATNQTTPVHTDESGNLHVVVSEPYTHHFWGLEFMHEVDTFNWIWPTEAAHCAALSPEWFGSDIHQWAEKIIRTDSALSLNSFVELQKDPHTSELIKNTVGGSFISYLQEQLAWKPSVNNPHPVSSLDSAFQSWKIFLSSNKILEKKHPQTKTYMGFNFAHEGYAIVNGYGSRKSKQSLQFQRDLHANSVAIIPYGFLESHEVPLAIRLAHGTGMENDESVVQTIQDAKALGLKVMLKPQLWIGNSWPGEVLMKNQKDWDLFFKHYERWILHYALLAEMYQIDLFCAGVELTHSTIEQPLQWIKLLNKIRCIYTGPVTYAANWGDEFEKFSFAHELDFLGLDGYYPLHRSSAASRSQLEQGFNKIIKIIEKKSKDSGKNIILTEIGYRSITSPWKEPHADDREATFLGDHQALCYEVMFNSLHNKSWLQGLFIWKFPSHLDAPKENRDYSPAFKPAQEVVKKWFAEL